MRTCGSITLVAAANPRAVVLGPFDEGSVLREIHISGIGQASSVMSCSVRVHRSAPGVTGAEIAEGTPLFNWDGDTIGAGADVVQCFRLAAYGMSTLSIGEHVLCFNEVMSDGNLGRFLSIMVDDSINATSFNYSVKFDRPEVREEDVRAASLPGTVKAPSAASRVGRSPNVVNRSSAPMPVQSFAGQVAQPVPRLKR